MKLNREKALRRYKLLKRPLKMMGIEEDRIRLEWISASEGDKVQAVMDEMVTAIRKLGPLRLEPRVISPQPQVSGQISAALHGGM